MASMLPPTFHSSVDDVTRHIYAFIALLVAVQLIALSIAYYSGAETKRDRVLIFKVTNAVGLVCIALLLLPLW